MVVKLAGWRFMIQFDEHIFQMGWFNHQLSKGNPTYPWSIPQTRNSFINCWLGVWGMLQGSVGKVLETRFSSPIVFNLFEALEVYP